MKMIRYGVAAMLTGVAMVAQAAVAGVEVHHAYVNSPPPGARVAAGFMVIHNNGDDAVTLTSIASPVAGKVELHNTTHENGRMMMRPVEVLEIAAHSAVELAPGGMHLMLLNLTGALVPDEVVSFDFGFSNGQQVSVSADIRDMRKAVEDDAGGHGDHHHHH